MNALHLVPAGLAAGLLSAPHCLLMCGPLAAAGCSGGPGRFVAGARGYFVGRLAAYALLGLETFFTAGPKEVHAWQLHLGQTAPQAAGTIHTDFERGFIRAEVISCDDYVACGGEQGAKDKGKMRLEGKDYVVNDGDVIYFRFNV